MNWLNRTLSKIFAKKISQGSSNFEKPSDSVQTGHGAFQYSPSGFTVFSHHSSTDVKWNDISEIRVYKRDLLTFDRIVMDIDYAGKELSINEDLPGWPEFLRNIKKVFPEIPSDWATNILMPTFAENQSVLYSRPSDFNLMNEGIDAKLDSLTKVGCDSDWNIYYLGSDGSQWIKSYPNSGYHAGGRPSLKKVDKFPELPGIKISQAIRSKTLSLIDHHFKTNVFFPLEANIWESGNAVYEGVFIQKLDDKRFMVHAQRHYCGDPFQLAEKANWEYDSLDDAYKKYIYLQNGIFD